MLDKDASIDKMNPYGSTDSLKQRSTSLDKRERSIDKVSEASYRNFLTNEQVQRRKILRHQPMPTALEQTMTNRNNLNQQSPEPNMLTSTNQNFHSETRKSAFPTMPRKK